jgi:hypothetical protein
LRQADSYLHSWIVLRNPLTSSAAQSRGGDISPLVIEAKVE